MAEIVRRVLSYRPPPIGKTRPDVSPALDAAIERALVKNPQERYPSAAAFADSLRSVREEREEDFVTEFIDDIFNDFNGDMPQKLGLEPLQARDAAWRAAPGEEARGALTSPSKEPARPGAAITSLPAQSERQRPTVVDEMAPPRRVSRGVFIAALAAIGAAGAAAVALSSRKPDPATSRFVVVERQTEPAASTTAPEPVPPAPTAAPVAVAPSAEASAVATTPPMPAPSSTAPARDKPASGKPDPAALSRQVQKHRGAIEACFTQHVKEVDGRPEVSVHFRVDTAGHVESADLFPSALNGTPLGQCILGVARAVQFGPEPEPLSFTIPITARRVTAK